MNIHFIAIGGAVMHNLAIVLKRQGHVVTGSDDLINDPAKTNLQQEGLLPERIGFLEDHIHAGLDAIILGMHARVDNVELLKAQQLGLRIYSFPEYLYEVSKNKTRVVIAGSHGKTTITAMVMHVLRTCGFDFDYMVGARVKGFDTAVRLSNDAPLIVLEGDEYLASPILRQSKFMFYRPQVALISGVAWDHINVFPVYEGYVDQFRQFASTMQPGGFITWFQEDAELQHIFRDYNLARHQPYNTLAHRIEDGVTIVLQDGAEYPMQVFGLHNLQNMAGAMLVCGALGISSARFLATIGSFEGAANRLQRLGEREGALVFKDFAHAPSKVRATLQAVRQQFTGKRIVAVAELHTFSSLDKNFLSQYAGSLDGVDEAAVFYDPQALAHKNMPPLSPALVKQCFANPQLHILNSADQLHAWLLEQPWQNAVLLLMSSGTFGGLSLDQLTIEVLEAAEKG